MRIGLLTGGGNMAGVNAAIRAVVKTAISHYGSEVVGIRSGFEGLLHPPQVQSLGLKDVHGFHRRASSILGQAPRGNPFHQTVAGKDVNRAAELVESVKWLGLDAVICIGGLGTIALARKVSNLGIPIVAIPKSTTNEISGTDDSIGFPTAVETAVSVIDRLHSVEEEGHLVHYLSVMGRDAGWTALHAALAGGAHVALIPEVPYDPAEVARAIEARRERGRPSTIIVYASGAHARDEDAKGSSSERLRRLCEGVHARNDLSYEVTRLGPVQRGGEPVSRDRVVAVKYGSGAVKAAHEGHLSHLVTIRHDTIKLLDLESIVTRPRFVDPASRLVWTAVSQGMSLGVAESELPLPATEPRPT